MFVNNKVLLSTVTILAACSPPVSGILKTFKRNNFLSNPHNFVEDDASCHGLAFPVDLNGSIIADESMAVNEIILPDFGQIFLQEGTVFEFEALNTGKCRKVKPVRHWVFEDPNNWSFDGDENKAIPDLERLPCLGDKVWMEGALGLDVDLSTVEALSKQTEECSSKSGCFCQRTDAIFNLMCRRMASNQQQPECLEPIQPSGFCHPICGGLIYAHVKHDFDLAAFRKDMPEFAESDVYSSKVFVIGSGLIQVVFVDKSGRYEGYSSEDARDFSKILLEDLAGKKIDALVVSVSGMPYHPGASAKKAFAIVFATLVTCILAFVGLFYVYGYNVPYFRLPSGRFNVLSEMSSLMPRTFTFARFENKDGGEISLSGASMSDLGRAFDNPLYGQPPEADLAQSSSLSQPKSVEVTATSATASDSDDDSKSDIDIGTDTHEEETEIPEMAMGKLVETSGSEE